MLETTKPKPFCFVLMPFDDAFSDIYALGIKEACKAAGAYCERVDEQIYEGGILDRIYNQISKADVVIADMTGRSPNVFYEVGYAHAIGKSTILLTQKSEDIPFDLKHYPHIVYNNKIVSLKDDLTKRVKWYIENPNIKIEEKLFIEVHNKGIDLSKNEPTFDGRLNDINNDSWTINLELTFFNNSTTTLNEGDFKVGAIFSENYSFIWNWKTKGIKDVKLPDKRTLSLFPYFDTLFPTAYTSYELTVYFKAPKENEKIIIRIFSSVGTRDFELNAIFKV